MRTQPQQRGGDRDANHVNCYVDWSAVASGNECLVPLVAAGIYEAEQCRRGWQPGQWVSFLPECHTGEKCEHPVRCYVRQLSQDEIGKIVVCDPQVWLRAEGKDDQAPDYEQHEP